MIADLKVHADYKDSRRPWLELVARWAEFSADVLAIEKKAEGLLGDLLGGHES